MTLLGEFDTWELEAESEVGVTRSRGAAFTPSKPRSRSITFPPTGALGARGSTSSSISFFVRVAARADEVVESTLTSHARDRLEKLATLGRNWDGEGGLEPHATALSSARALLAMSKHLSPEVGPVADGSVELEWSTPQGREVHVYCLPSGSFEVLQTDATGETELMVDRDEAISMIRAALRP